MAPPEPKNQLPDPAARYAGVRANFARDAHFIQNCYTPKRPPNGGQFLYVKMHKGASTTVLSTLASSLYNASGRELPKMTQLEVHKTPISVFQRARNIGFERLVDLCQDPNVFTFTFVREPVRRVVSAWTDKIARGDPQLRRLNRYLGQSDDKPVSLNSFVALMVEDAGARDLDHHWRPQWKEGAFDTLTYDFIGDVSRLPQDLTAVSKRLFGDNAAQIVDTRKSLGHETSSGDVVAELSAAQVSKLRDAYSDDSALYERVRSQSPA